MQANAGILRTFDFALSCLQSLAQVFEMAGLCIFLDAHYSRYFKEPFVFHTLNIFSPRDMIWASEHKHHKGFQVSLKPQLVTDASSVTPFFPLPGPKGIPTFANSQVVSPQPVAILRSTWPPKSQPYCACFFPSWKNSSEKTHDSLLEFCFYTCKFVMPCEGEKILN